MDSKYIEMIMIEDFGQVSRLADFTYSFLGNFAVDKTYRKVRKCNYGEREKADELRL